jgi:hypothetical protein
LPFGGSLSRGLQGPESVFDALADGVEPDRQNQDQSDGDHLVERVDVEEVQTVSQDADHQGADECVRYLPAAAEEAGAADDSGVAELGFEGVVGFTCRAFTLSSGSFRVP